MRRSSGEHAERRGRAGLDRTGLKTKEIVSRQALRFDLVRGIADTEPFSALAKGGPWCAAIRQALGVDMKLIKSGCVVAMPGCPRQPVHPDGKHLFDEGDHLPPHCITVFVPLIDMSEQLGPTEFYPGTHRRDCPRQDYKACETGDCEGVAFTSAKAGDAVMFDYRVLHRGGANSSTRQRPLTVLHVRASPWFTDATTTTPAVSLDDCYFWHGIVLRYESGASRRRSMRAGCSQTLCFQLPCSGSAHPAVQRRGCQT